MDFVGENKRNLKSAIGRYSAVNDFILKGEMYNGFSLEYEYGKENHS